MRKPKPYAELVTQAEEATRPIKDAELRRVAFERVLDDLLTGGSTATQSGYAPKRVDRSTRVAGEPRKSSGPKGYVRELIDDGFFKKPKTIAQVKAELANRGHHIALTSLSGPLQTLCQDRFLRRHKAKSGQKAGKSSFNYSEW